METVIKLTSFGFSSLRNHCLLFPDVDCLENHCFIYFVHFLVASDGRVTLVPFFHPGQKQESEKLILAILDIQIESRGGGVG